MIVEWETSAAVVSAQQQWQQHQEEAQRAQERPEEEEEEEGQGQVCPYPRSCSLCSSTALAKALLKACRGN